MGKIEGHFWQVARRASRALEKSAWGIFVLDCSRTALAVVHGFRGEKISLRASALTYITILSLVPLLAVIFAVVRGLGQENLRRTVREFIFNNLAPGAREQISRYLDQFIARASSGALGGLGAIFLVVSAVGLFHNIEQSINEIWGINRPRPLLNRIFTYWIVLTVGPIALGISLFATGWARSAVEHSVPSGVWAMVPLASSIFIFAFIYLTVPNDKVDLRAALGGAVVAGAAWEIAKHAYAVWAAHSFRYNAIYGSVGAIPLFLVWVYVSWLLLLFGARLAYALQYAASGYGDLLLKEPRAREVFFARVALAVTVDYLALKEPPTAADISKSLGYDYRVIHQAVESLKEAGIMAQTAHGGLVPARPPQQIHLVDIAQAAAGTFFCKPLQLPIREATIQSLSGLFAHADQQGRASLQQVDLASLAQPLLGESA